MQTRSDVDDYDEEHESDDPYDKEDDDNEESKFLQEGGGLQ